MDSFASAEITTPLTFQEGVSALGMEFILENSGHSPALRVDLKQMMLVRKQNSLEEMQKVATACSGQRRKDFIYGAGGTIFPGQKMPRKLLIVMDKDDTHTFKTRDDVAVMLAGCVKYVSTDYGDVHRTFFVAELDKKGSGDTPFLALPRNLNIIPASDLVLASNPTLEGTAD